MKSGKLKFILLFAIQLLFLLPAMSQHSGNEGDKEVLNRSIELLKRYFLRDNHWYVTNPEVARDVRGLVNFIEDEPVDSILTHLYNTFSDTAYYVFRLPEHVADSLLIPGYMPVSEIRKEISKISEELKRKNDLKKAVIPDSVIFNAKSQAVTIAPGNGMQLFRDGVYKMPEHLRIPEVIPDSVLNSPEKFQQLVRTDSIRNAYVEQKRIQYNDSLVAARVNMAKMNYLNRKFNREFAEKVRRITDSVKINNYDILRNYNERVVQAVNDSILFVLETLAEYADYIDSTKISFVNLTGDYSDIILKNGSPNFTRVWLKNLQKDSLSVLVKNIDKRSVYMLIDDGVTISRYKPKETKNFSFRELEKNISSLKEVGDSYNLYTPWMLGGEGHVGFSQIYLENWKKGGQSAISSLVALKGFANYASRDRMVKWENSGELRNGWLRQGGNDQELQKNDDRFELTSRLGLSAFKKWYYSAEMNFETQFFRGYRYPKKENAEPISAFWAPAKTFFKIGLEYKPDKNFSLLLSPLTIKNVYVRDTALVDQTKYGIDPDKKSFWEPGLNADIFWRKNLTTDITYETKYKMFINYQAPFSKFDLNWENVLNMQLSDYITMRFLLHFIYDDDILFPVYENEVKVGEKPRLQIKEFFSIGFTYKINRRVIKSERIR